MFRYITINHSDPTFERRVIPCDVPPLTNKSKKVESWGVLKIQINKHANVAFFRLFQLAERFADVELDQKGNKPKWEDPEITMIVVKKAKCPPRGGSSTCETEYAFLEGVAAKRPSVGVRIDSMRGGEYLVIYKADWKPYHKCQKLNLRFSGPEDVVDEAKISRINPTSYKDSFFSRLQARLRAREKLQSHFNQPKV